MHWMVVPVVLIVLVIVCGRWWRRISNGLGVAAKWLYGFLVDSRTCGVAKTCCGEAAVLLLVFPTLDTLYDHKNLSDPFLHKSIEVAGLFFLFAIVLSHAEKPDQED